MCGIAEHERAAYVSPAKCRFEWRPAQRPGLFLERNSDLREQL